MGKPAQYLVTPRRGRVHKARQVPAFRVNVGERHGDLLRLEEQIEIALRKHAKRNDLIALVKTTGVASAYEAVVYLPGVAKPVALCDVEAVEQ